MKKVFHLIVICTMLVYLTSCGAKMPVMAVDGTPWSKDWTTLGRTLGVETPGYDLTLRDSKSARNMDYIAWSIGEAQSELLFKVISDRSEMSSTIVSIVFFYHKPPLLQMDGVV